MLRALEPSDRPHLEALAADATALVGHAVDLVSWLDTPSGGSAHAWISDEGAIRMTPTPRLRCRHIGAVELVAKGDASALLDAVVQLADRWSPLDRLDLELPAAHPAVASALALGFDLEVTRRARLPDGRDTVVLGRLRPGFSPRPLPPPPEFPARHRRALGETTWRRVAEADSAAIQALSVDPISVFGTLQSPSSSVDFYVDRFRKSTPDNLVHVLTVGEELAGLGGLHPTGVPGVAMIGMAVASPWQGCGAGRRLFDHLVAEARARGNRRLELSVYVDNERARKLYESGGFVAEGVRRCEAIRDGGHASSLEMALALGLSRGDRR